MAFLENGNTIINDSGNGAFTSLTVTANSRIYIGQNFYTTAAGNIFQGTRYGYVGVGYSPSIPGGTISTIERFSFVNDGNASVIGDMSFRTRDAQLSSSATNGYQAGGFTGNISIIQKFPFAVDYGVKATEVGRFLTYPNTSPLTAQPYLHAGAGQSSIPYGYGYSSGGNGGTSVNRIYKYAFSSNGDSIPVGNLTAPVMLMTGISSTTSGYTAGGYALAPSTFDSNPAPYSTTKIDKFPFATDTNASTVANLAAARVRAAGGSSPTSGYVAGGIPFPLASAPTVSTIAKFTFASDSSVTVQSAVLTSGRYNGGDASSVSSGYVAGGKTSTSDPSVISNIQKYSFVNDTNATSVGNLVIARHNFMGGHQV